MRGKARTGSGSAVVLAIGASLFCFGSSGFYFSRFAVASGTMAYQLSSLPVEGRLRPDHHSSDTSQLETR